MITHFLSETYSEENEPNMRFFADYHGVPEDPATGSANRCLAWYLVKHRYSGKNQINIPVEQGYEIRRPLLLLPRQKKKGEK
jgi:trans-2,3-dihydro-3-hydroxyanthranilate isomerase